MTSSSGKLENAFITSSSLRLHDGAIIHWVIETGNRDTALAAARSTPAKKEKSESLVRTIRFRPNPLLNQELMEEDCRIDTPQPEADRSRVVLGQRILLKALGAIPNTDRNVREK